MDPKRKSKNTDNLPLTNNVFPCSASENKLS